MKKSKRKRERERERKRERKRESQMRVYRSRHSYECSAIAAVPRVYEYIFFIPFLLSKRLNKNSPR